MQGSQKRFFLYKSNAAPVAKVLACAKNKDKLTYFVTYLLINFVFYFRLNDSFINGYYYLLV